MAYTPSTLTLASWTVPISIVGTDAITSLDNSVNAIIDTDANSAKAYLNTELAKIPTYLSGEMTAIYNDLAGQVNVIAGLTSSASELNILDGATVTTAELNLLDGVTATTAELNYIDGVTSSIQTQLNGKASLSGATFTGAISATNLTSGTYTPTFTNMSNVSSASVYANSVRYIRVGDIVTVSGRIYIDPVATGAGTVDISLPISSSFTSTYQASGTIAMVSSTTSVAGYVTARSGTSSLIFLANFAISSGHDLMFTCQYQIV